MNVVSTCVTTHGKIITSTCVKQYSCVGVPSWGEILGNIMFIKHLEHIKHQLQNGLNDGIALTKNDIIVNILCQFPVDVENSSLKN